MDNKWQKDYPLQLNLTEASLGENSSLKKMLRLVGVGKRVIEFGCATGYFAQLLSEKQCKVTGIEVNQAAAEIAKQHCEDVRVADLDFISPTELLPEEKFDVAVFGDVLEHLRNPWKVLEETRQLLNSDGCVVASIPNIAHGSIRLALIQGRFDYAESGILDDTHLRFFTYKTVIELFERSGYFVDKVERTKAEIFAPSPLLPSVNRESFESSLISEVESSEEADTLQFIVRAFPISLQGRHAALVEHNFELIQQFEQSQAQLQQTQVAFEQSQAQLQQTQVAFEQSQAQLQQTQVAFEQSQTQLQQTQAAFEQSQTQLQQAYLEEQKLKFVIEQNQEKVEDLLIKLRSIESSKFWKLKKVWLKISGPIKSLVKL
jgi:2-polyprenyl-3-methyl-5-hydroxy-6-metoxy-1,4-benzoquinol methylase